MVQQVFSVLQALGSHSIETEGKEEEIDWKRGGKKKNLFLYFFV